MDRYKRIEDLARRAAMLEKQRVMIEADLRNIEAEMQAMIARAAMGRNGGDQPAAYQEPLVLKDPKPPAPTTVRVKIVPPDRENFSPPPENTISYAILDYLRKAGVAKSLTEIATAIEHATNATSAHLQRLMNRGMV